jgi:hypothetical protein
MDGEGCAAEVADGETREIRGICVRAEREYEDSPALPTIVDYRN